MIQDCPKCGLGNPPEAMRCDCGHDFLAAAIQTVRPNAVAARPTGLPRHWLTASVGLKWLIISQVVSFVGTALPAILPGETGSVLGALVTIPMVIAYLVGLGYCSWVPPESGARSMLTSASVLSRISAVAVGGIWFFHFVRWAMDERRPYPQSWLLAFATPWQILVVLGLLLALVGFITLLLGLSTAVSYCGNHALSKGLVVYGLLVVGVPIMVTAVFLAQRKVFLTQSERNDFLETSTICLLASNALMTLCFCMLANRIAREFEQQAGPQKTTG